MHTAVCRLLYFCFWAMCFRMQGYWTAARASVLSGKIEQALWRFNGVFHHAHKPDCQIVPLLVEVVSLCISNKGWSKCESDCRTLNMINLTGKGKQKNLVPTYLSNTQTMYMSQCIWSFDFFSGYVNTCESCINLCLILHLYCMGIQLCEFV